MVDFLLLIRSGKTSYDQEGRIKGTLDLPLSPSGMEEARSFADRAGRMLDPLLTGVSFASNQIRRLFTSPARCARETAEIVGRRLGLKPQPCPGLGNLDHGLWQGLRVDEIEARQPRLHRQWLENPWSVAPPQGELLDECCDRVAATLERIAKRHGQGGIAVVVPEPLERVIRWVVAGEPVGDLWRPVEGEEGVRLLLLAEQWAIRPLRLPPVRPPEPPRMPHLNGGTC